MLELPAITSGQPLLDVIHHTDLLTLCGALPSASVDMILCDLPYGTTACAWDSIIPLEPMWEQFKRVIKPRGAIVLTASQPFTSKLVMSNPEMFKYTWVWEKSLAANFMNAKNKPLAYHEDICVFSSGVCANGSSDKMNYYPQDIVRSQKQWRRPAKYPSEHNFVRPSHQLERVIEFSNYPTSIISFANGNNNSLHPTQKPVALFEYLIRTYTQPGEIVLDPCIGSGTTAIAARQTGRHFIGGDITPEYVDIARARLAKPYTPPLFREDVPPSEAKNPTNLPLFADALA